MVPGRFVDGTCVVLDFWTFEFLDFFGFLWISPLFCPQTLDYITQQRGWQRRKDEWCKWGPASYFENLAGCFFPHQSHINTAYGGGKRDITCSCVGYCGRLGRAIGRTFRYYCKFQKVTAQEGKGDTRGLSCSFQLQALSSITGKCVRHSSRSGVVVDMFCCMALSVSSTQEALPRGVQRVALYQFEVSLFSRKGSFASPRFFFLSFAPFPFFSL